MLYIKSVRPLCSEVGRLWNVVGNPEPGQLFRYYFTTRLAGGKEFRKSGGLWDWRHRLTGLVFGGQVK
jgi:hypothetical protein